MDKREKLELKKVIEQATSFADLVIGLAIGNEVIGSIMGDKYSLDLKDFYIGDLRKNWKEIFEQIIAEQMFSEV